jgi:hypothetical protein
LLQVLRRNDIHAWHGRFVRQLQASTRPDVVSGSALPIGQARAAG